MKAIKIASGVAVSALALAISAQANAAAHEGGATETEWSFAGSMEAVYLINMEGEDGEGKDATVMDVDLDEGDDFDSATAGEAWGLEAEMGIVHGPFSGSVGIRSDDGEVEAFVGDLVVTDGAISFGQVGSVISTHDYAFDMGDSETGVTVDQPTGSAVWDDANENGTVDVGEIVAETAETTYAEDLDEGAPVDVALRYTMGGLQVQVEGQNDSSSPATDYGLGVAYAGSADALEYVVDANVRASDQSPKGADAYTYVGAGVTYTADMFTVKAGYNTYNRPTDATQLGNGKKDANSEYGVEVTAAVTEGVSLYVKAQDLEAGESTDSMRALFGASYAIDMITVTGEYTYTAFNEDTEAADVPTMAFADIGDVTTWGDALDNVFAEVAYTDGPISAYADVTVYVESGDAFEDFGPQIGAGVSYTQENGVKYAADYDTQDYGVDGVANQNEIKLSAAYAF